MILSASLPLFEAAAARLGSPKRGLARRRLLELNLCGSEKPAHDKGSNAFRSGGIARLRGKWLKINKLEHVLRATLDMFDALYRKSHSTFPEQFVVFRTCRIASLFRGGIRKRPAPRPVPCLAAAQRIHSVTIL